MCVRMFIWSTSAEALIEVFFLQFKILIQISLSSSDLKIFEKFLFTIRLFFLNLAIQICLLDIFSTVKTI